MKKLFIITAIACILIGCKDESAKTDFGMVKIRGYRTVSASQKAKQMSEYIHLSDKEIVRQTFELSGLNTDGFNSTRGFADVQKDTVNNVLMMWPEDIIYNENGSYKICEFFITMRNVIIRRVIDYTVINGDYQFDTIAYIPNSVIIRADSVIHEMYKKSDFDGIKKEFNTAFTFLPVTGKEWRELEKAGK